MCASGEKMRITIVGGGNIGTQFAVHCAEKGHNVTIYTSTPDIFKKQINIVDEKGQTTHIGEIEKATNNPEEAFSNVDCIIITWPAMVMDQVVDPILEYSSKETKICVVPGSGGSECIFEKCIDRGNIFFGMERVPAVARLIKKGETVKSVGYRDELHISSIPIDKGQECCDLIESIFNKPCTSIPNYLNLTLTPSNSLLHTTRLRILFKDYKEGVFYDKLPLFYEEWDDETSELLLKCDDELQSICKALKEINLSGVKSLREHYGSYTVEEMTKKISSIEAFKGLKTPQLVCEEGLAPDFHSRYFTADFSFGLAIIKQVADMANVEVPNIDETMKWYESLAVEHKHFNYTQYGIKSKKELISFYLR